jgi:hypothetical protein
MPVYKGFLGKINEKSGTGKRGPWTLYSAKLQDESGEDSSDWISFGFDKPKVKQGDYVKITVDDSGERPKVTEVKALKNAPARAAEAKKADSKGTTVTEDRKQRSIHMQNSRTAAIAAVQLLATHDALALPKAGTKPAEAKRYDIITAAIDKLTVQYFNDLESMRLLETVADAGAVDTKPDAPLPSADKDDEDEEEEEEADEEEEEEEEEEDDE